MKKWAIPNQPNKGDINIKLKTSVDEKFILWKFLLEILSVESSSKTDELLSTSNFLTLLELFQVEAFGENILK